LQTIAFLGGVLNPLANKIASLTAISTPHRGSALADLIHNQKIFHSEIAKKNS
jgi:triacylglycerol esterase/lipase EstA (alpha/beta hydrolase family)